MKKKEIEISELKSKLTLSIESSERREQELQERVDGFNSTKKLVRNHKNCVKTNELKSSILQHNYNYLKSTALELTSFIDLCDDMKGELLTYEDSCKLLESHTKHLEQNLNL